MNDIELLEYESKTVEDLDRADADYIATTLKQKIDIWRDPLNSACVLNPSQFVGVVVLPSERRLRSSPKVPVTSLFHMLAIAYEFPRPFREQVARFDTIDQLFEFIAQFFAELVEEQIANGLYRAYVEVEENLTAVRGRIVFTEDLRQNYLLRHRTFCRYSEFTWDVPENQVVRYVTRLLAGWDFSPRLRLRLSQLDADLDGITPTAPTVETLGGLTYHRLNEHYRQVHALCRLFFEASSLAEKFGELNFKTFLLDMNKLFEAFVTQALRGFLPRWLAVEDQVPLYLGEDKRVFMRPDIVIKAEGRALLVSDCKYKRNDPEEFKNHDQYQILAYCTAARVEDGLLIYPRHMEELDDSVIVRNSRVTIRQVSINLGAADLLDECRRLSDVALGLARKDRT